MTAPVFNNSPTEGCCNVPYLFTWDITADPAPTTQLMGALPSGLILSNNVGNNNPVISGTPDTIGSYTLSVWSATDEVTVQEFTIVITGKCIFGGRFAQE
jgi:hypothetical protein